MDMHAWFGTRIARLNYFIAGLAVGILGAVLAFLLSFIHLGLLVPLIGLVELGYSFSLAIRRLHDLSWSGWLSLLAFVPLVNLVFWLILLFKAGTEGSNEYGPAPQTELDVMGTLFPKAVPAPAVPPPSTPPGPSIPSTPEP